MKRLLVVSLLFAGFLIATPRADAQQLRYLVIDGTATPPTVVETNLAAADRPVIVRLAKGVYQLTFRFDIRFFNGGVQRGGPAHDASQMLFTSVFATNNARVIRVFTYAFSAGNPTRTAAEDGRLSILVVR